MKNQNKNFILLMLCLLFIIVVGAFNVIENNNENKKLRKNYPLISDSEYLIDDAALNFNDRISIAPSIAKIEIISQLPNYDVDIEDKEIGISSKFTFCQFQAKLISNITAEKINTDNNGMFIIVFAKNYLSSYPTLSAGMQAICSLEKATGAHSGKYILFDRTFYYIDDNRALAAYENDDSPAKNICEEKVLINEIISIRETLKLS